jgi:AraC family ethanolamine operon transcriptional activator
MEHALSAWDHRYRQISPGAFHGSLLHTQVGSLGIFRNRWERAIHYLGVAPEGTVALALTLAQSGEGRWNGQRMGPDDMIVAGCGVEGEYLSAPLWDSVVFAIPGTELTRQIAELTHDDPRDFVAHGIARLTPQAAAQVRQAARGYLDASARALARRDAPSPLPEMARAMIELLAHALVSTQPPRSQKQSLNRQRQLIRKAEAYCELNKAQPLRIGQLCLETDISERSLRAAFHKLTGMSPLVYLKTEQLNRAHDLLRAGNPDETLIKNVALANGFSHLGQFSQSYKQLFGELPSETIKHY